MTKNIYVKGFAFLPLHIYRRHLSLPGRIMCPIPDLPLIDENSLIFSSKCFKCSYAENYALLNVIFGKHLVPRKELTRFAWSKPLQKYWAGITFGYLS